MNVFNKLLYTMDCLFNKKIPQGTEKKIILRPSGKL